MSRYRTGWRGITGQIVNGEPVARARRRADPPRNDSPRLITRDPARPPRAREPNRIQRRTVLTSLVERLGHGYRARHERGGIETRNRRAGCHKESGDG